ncbi:MAG: ATP-binding protein, partial [Flammeovirgaceae bacterium]
THITVKDTGIGIDMRYAKDKIFTMYQHFHPEINGKGFGLFLVRSQIEAMNGRITVESEVGKGTTFNIVFKNNGHH